MDSDGGRERPFDGLSETEAKEFAARWLPAWTGNDPERLASFYAEDCFYSDPRSRTGSRATRRYRLLPGPAGPLPRLGVDQPEAVPIEGGFLNVWHATIPIGQTMIECDGVCTVELRDGLIARNEVYFDRSELLAAIG